MIIAGLLIVSYILRLWWFVADHIESKKRITPQSHNASIIASVAHTAYLVGSPVLLHNAGFFYELTIASFSITIASLVYAIYTLYVTYHIAK